MKSRTTANLSRTWEVGADWTADDEQKRIGSRPNAESILRADQRRSDIEGVAGFGRNPVRFY